MKTANPDKMKKGAPLETRQCLVSTPSGVEGSLPDKPFSKFDPPISNVKTCGEMTLRELYELIISGSLKALTEKVRRNNRLKSIILPYITPSGVFRIRADSELITYSNIVHLDLDHLTDKHNLNLDDVKRLLAEDKVLNLNLLHESPTGTGLKCYFTIKGAVADEHDLYYTAALEYMAKKYNLEPDPSCRNISRACFVTFDPGAWISEGCIKRAALLALLPIPAAAPATVPYVSTATSVPVFSKPTATDEPRPSDLLNRDPRVHERAGAALKADGWVQVNDFLWRRPGKDVSHSAIYNYFDREDMYFFTNFSSNSPHFGRKGYTDVMLICELEFNGNWDETITQLAHEYL